ncbi:hypothetical protein DL96DRAFT_1703572 [Flagelloscypha sp. PMI_526]|nr:hypothetical protein DL96DRAFT_1703572 [Flagelloscypha sp. PMI_526]
MATDATLRENPQARQLALSNLLPHTAPGAAHRPIFLEGLQSGSLQKSKESDIIRDLKLLCRDQLAISHDAFRALVNLSESSLVAACLSDPVFLNFIVSYIIHPQSTCADLAAMLLSNLSGSATACAIVISMKIEIIRGDNLPNNFYPVQSRCGTCTAPDPYPKDKPESILALPLLVDAFLQGSAVTHDNDPSKRPRKAELHFLASVFANLASVMSLFPCNPFFKIHQLFLVSRWANFFLTSRPTNELDAQSPRERPLAKLMAFTEHKDKIRRGGIVATIKNCAFDPTLHKAILTEDDSAEEEGPGAGGLVALLLPLAGPEESELEDQENLPEALQMLPPDKKRETDPAIRLTIVETLLLLCHTRFGRDYQRNHGVYEIIRAAHLVEKDEKILEHIERLVNLLKRDEGDNAESAPYQASRIEEVHQPEQSDSDDEDLRIEEI